MSAEQLWAMLPRLPWRIAVTRLRPAVYRQATPILCLPGVAPARCRQLHRQGCEVWSFDYLGSGASDPCLPGHEPSRLRQIAAVAALIQAGSSAARLVLVAPMPADAELFASTYPFVVERVEILQGDEDEPASSDRGDFRGAAA